MLSDANHLTIWQHVAALGRRVSTLCKGEEGLAQQLALYHSDDNFCQPPGRLRQPLHQPVPTNGIGSVKQWQPCTPAMAAGLTDHVWSRKAVLLYRVPPWPQPRTVSKPSEVDERIVEGLRVLRYRSSGVDGVLQTGFA